MKQLGEQEYCDNLNKISQLIDGAKNANRGHGVAYDLDEIQFILSLDLGLFIKLGEWDGFIWAVNTKGTLHVDQCYTIGGDIKELNEAFECIHKWCKEHGIDRVLINVSGERYKPFFRLLRKYNPTIRTVVGEIHVR